MRGSNTSKGEGGEGEFQVERDQSQLGQEHTTQKDMLSFQRSGPLGCDSQIIQGKITRATLTDKSEMSVKVITTRFM